MSDESESNTTYAVPLKLSSYLFPHSRYELHERILACTLHIYLAMPKAVREKIVREKIAKDYMKKKLTVRTRARRSESVSF